MSERTTDDPCKTASGYMPQLDGLRAVAILMVFLCHWAPGSMTSPLGRLGVYGFFVLSGFLITGILLGMREEAGAPKRTLADMLKTFVIRRSLRIFPAYFGLVAVMVFLDENIRRDAVWYLTYTANILVGWRGTWEGLGVMGHLWSLALEEQFYLVWPILMLVTPWRRVPWVFFLTLGLGVASRLVLAIRGVDDGIAFVFPLSALDFFAVGGMLAWVRLNRPGWWKNILTWGGWIALPLAVVLAAGSIGHWHAMPWQIMKITLVAVVWAVVVARAAEGETGIFGCFLSFPPLRWLGRISYGLYLFHHPLVPGAILFLCGAMKIEGWHALHQGVRFAISFAVVTLVAAASYYLFEKPFLRLKKRWE